MGITLNATGTGDSGDPYVVTVTTDLADLLGDNVDNSTLEVQGGKVEVKDAGVTMDKIAHEAWTDYDPQWGATSVNPAINDGVIEARYIDIGNTCHFSIHIVPGAGTSLGSGFYSLTLPHSPYGSNTSIVKPFYGNIFVSSTAANASIVLLVRQDSSSGYLFIADSTNARVDSTTPVALSTDTSINICGSFEFA